MNELQSILTQLGYPIQNMGNYLKIPALFRGGRDNSSVTVYAKDNRFIDHVTGENFSLLGLVKRHFSLKDENEAKDILKTKNINVDNYISEIESQEVNLDNTYPSIYPAELLNKLVPDHSYWLNRGISLATLKLFRGGLVKEKENKFSGRYTFGIFARDGQTINGFSGRKCWKGDDKSPKYKIVGRKLFFLYPLFLTEKYIKETGIVILTEGCGDDLTLYDQGIKNSICLFGTKLSSTVLCTLIELNPNKIIIATNNEPDNKNIGLVAAEKIKKQLQSYFSSSKIKIALPPLKDFNETFEKLGEDSIKTWFNEAVK